MLLELLKGALPEGETLPNNYYKTKEHANANECIACGVSRWKSSDVHPIYEFNQSSKKKKIPA